VPDGVSSRSVEPRDRSLAGPGSVEALTTWTSTEGHMMVASIGDDGTIRRWDATAGAEIGDPLLVDAGRPTALIYWSSHDIPMLASGHSDGTIRRWDATTGSPIGKPLGGHISPIRALAAWRGPDDQVMLASGHSDGTIRRWDATTDSPIGKPLTGHTDWIRALAAWRGSDDHAMLASGSDDGTIRRWDATTGAALGISRVDSRISKIIRRSSRDWVFALTVWRNPDGRILLASGSQYGRLQLWDAETGISVGDLSTGNAWGINSLVTWDDPGGRITLAAGSSGTEGIIRRWDVASRVQESPLTVHTEAVESLAAWAGPDGRAILISGGVDGTICGWDATTGAPVGSPLTGHSRPVSALAAWTSRDGYPMLASASAGAVQRWNALAGIPVGVPLQARFWLAAGLTTWTGEDGRTVLAFILGDNSIQCYDADIGRPMGRPFGILSRFGHRPRTSNMTALAAWNRSNGQRMLASGDDHGTVHTWDPTEGILVASFSRHRWLRHTRSLLNGLSRLLTRLPFFWRFYLDEVTALTSWSGPHGSALASLFDDNTVRCWDGDTLTPIGKPIIDQYQPTGALAVWTRPGEVLVLGRGYNDGKVRLWDASNGAQIGEPLTGHTGGVEALTAWTEQDGRILLASGGDDGSIRLWDTSNGAQIGEPLTGHTGGVVALTAWTGSDGHTMLASGARDGAMRVWDIGTGELLSRVLVEPIRLHGLADRPASRDLLGRLPLTQALANLLLWRPTEAGTETGPSVVTIEGPWGSGKTTIMRLIESRISSASELPNSPRRLSVTAARKILRHAEANDVSEPNIKSSEYYGALTAWFNPWVYQSSEQVWAGLARCITEAAKPILYPSEAPGQAQRYWLTRNAPRIDRFAISRNLILRSLSPLLGFGVLIAAGTILINFAKINSSTLFHISSLRVTPSTLALFIAIIFLICGALHSAIRFFGPASIFLPGGVASGPVLSGSFPEDSAATAKIPWDPTYWTESGYLQAVQADTARTIQDLQYAGRDLVVFIDDLDRCSPRTTTEVFEAINLFLSGTTDLEAKFVIGLDPAIVAAHLDNVYKDLDKQHLFQYGDDPSPGWAFLRKVVQLPVGTPYVEDTAMDQFLAAALDVPTEVVRAAVDKENGGGGRTDTPSYSTVPGSPGTSDDTSQISFKVEFRKGPLERQPEILSLLKNRLNAQSERSARESKRLLNVWQLYQRVLDIIEPLSDEEEIVQRACHLIILAEIITRWPAIQRLLHRPSDGRTGLQILAETCNDDRPWTNAIDTLRLTEIGDVQTATSLRDLLRTYNGVAIANLAARVL
jgi:WD40 repeat protein